MTTESLKQTPASDPAATGRAYSFTIEVTPDGKRAVVITEVRQVDDRYERHCVVVGESELAGFIGGLQAAAGTLRPEAEPSRAYSVRDVRGQHPKAYAAWSPADDQRLLARHRQGECGRTCEGVRSASGCHRVPARAVGCRGAPGPVSCQTHWCDRQAGQTRIRFR